ncbi:MAG: outer membrane lipoprotein carrier protein LolA [bacterium]
MKLKVWFITVGSVMFFSLVGRGAAISPQEIIEKVEHTFYTQKTFYAVFQEKYIWELTGEEQVVKGELLLKGEDKFRISTEDQIIVSDGMTLKTYNKLENQILIDNLETTDDDLLPSRILFKYKQKYNSQLLGTDDIQGKSCYEILFTPGEEDLFYKEVRIWVEKDRWIPRKIEQKSIDGNTTIYVLLEVTLGVSIKENDFILATPPGVEVIDMR